MIRTIGVVIPVADEQELLARCLTAVQDSARELHCRAAGVVVRVVVVLDACTDDSAGIASAFAAETVVVQERRVGSARRAGCDRLVASGSATDELWLANTDADSLVPRDWLTGMFDEAEQGADVVLGTVRPETDLPGGLLARWLNRHVRTSGHPHVHGANFGIRASAYQRLGGWPQLATGEDQVLADRAAAVPGVHVARTGRFPVATSARLNARAPYGFSSYLRGLAAQ